MAENGRARRHACELALYALSSAASAAVDLGFYALFSRVILKNYVNTPYTAARLIGANFNFFLNETVVFKRGRERRAARYVSYFTLALVLMAAGNALVALLHRRLGMYDITAKIVTDLSLFVVSYTVQKFLIFKKRSKKA